jgi:hypothetical protein
MMKRFVAALAFLAATAGVSVAQSWVPIVALWYNGQGSAFPHYFYIDQATTMCAAWMQTQPLDSTCTFVLQNPVSARSRHKRPVILP